MCKDKEKTATVEDVCELARRLDPNQRAMICSTMEFLLNYKEFGTNTESFIDDLTDKIKGFFGKKKEAEAVEE